MITVKRYHDISCGHRVVGHEGKCRHLHGHNYRIHFTCAASLSSMSPLDSLGRVIDFGVIKDRLCEWLEDNWDHRMLIWAEDPLLDSLRDIDPTVVVVPFNPTAENMANYLLHQICPSVLPNNVWCVEVQIDETRKCSASASLILTGFENPTL